MRSALHDKNARARRTVPPPKWPPRTNNKSPRDSPHLVQLGQSMELSMALKVASSSPPTLWSHLRSTRFKVQTSAGWLRKIAQRTRMRCRRSQNATFCDSKGYTLYGAFNTRRYMFIHTLCLYIGGMERVKLYHSMQPKHLNSVK